MRRVRLRCSVHVFTPERANEQGRGNSSDRTLRSPAGSHTARCCAEKLFGRCALTPKEIDLLHSVWLEFSSRVAPEELHHHDVIHFALDELLQEMRDGKQEELVGRLRQHLQEIKDRREPHL